MPREETTPLISSNNGSTPEKCEVQIQPVKRLITVEPLVLLAVAFLSGTFTTTQYMYSSIAQEYNYTAFSISKGSQCDVNTTEEQGSIQKEVQQVSTMYNMLNSAAGILPSIVTNIFWGSYTDKAGRKCGIIVPMCGCALKTLLQIIIVATGVPIYWLIVANFVASCVGGETSIIMTSYAYVADITTTQQRSARVFAVSLTLMIGGTTFLVSVSYLIIAIGYTYTYVCILGLCIPGIVYAVFFLPEPLLSKARVKILTFAHFSGAIEIYKTKTSPRRTCRLVSCIILVVVSYFSTTGATETYNLYFLNQPFCWSTILVNAYMGYYFLAQGLGGIGLIWLTSKCIRDEGRIIIGTVFGMLYYTCLMLIYNTPTAFIAPVFAVGLGLIAPMARSVATKIVQPDEQGRLQSAIAPLEQACLFGFTFVNNSLYAVSLGGLRGLNFLASGAIMVILFFIAVCLLVKSRSEDSLPKQSETNSGNVHRPRTTSYGIKSNSA